jgi:hypothetical protein
MTQGSQEGAQANAYRTGSATVTLSPKELTARLPNLEVTEVLG